VEGVLWEVSREVETIDVPDNLQTLLAARLDRLNEETRRVLQMAAVIGRTFYYRVLQNISDTLNGLDGQLVTLQRTNMILEAARLPELEFAFRHALVQETAYRSILRKQRREFHRRVGETMENLFATRLDEYAPVLAMHFERAGDSARAFDYYLRAGDVAYRLHAIKEAISHYSQALIIVRGENLASEPLIPDTLRHLCLRLGRALEMDGQYDEAIEHYSELNAFALVHGDRELELLSLAAHATVYSAPTDKFDRERSETLSQQALALAVELGNHETEAKIYWNLMNMLGFSGEPEKSYAYGAKSLEIARRYDLKEQLAYTLNDFQRATLMKGQIEEAHRLKEEARQLWLELGNQAMYADSLISGALIYLIQGDYDHVEEACLEALQLCQEIGNLWGQGYSFYTLGYLYTNQSKFDKAIEAMQNALKLVEPSGFAVPLVDSNGYTGLIYGYLGDFERGRAFALAGLSYAKERLPAMQPGPLAVLAILAYWQGNYAEMDEWLGDSNPVPQVNSFTSFQRFVAECHRWMAKGAYQTLIDQSSEILPHIRPMGNMVFLADILYLNGEALLTLGRFDEARQFLEEAKIHSVHTPHRKIEIQFALSKLEAALGNYEAAAVCLTEAHQHIEIVLQNIPEPQLKESYLARPQIKAILDSETSEVST
jgi:tetratricopeptide (TPR) repeat protein